MSDIIQYKQQIPIDDSTSNDQQTDSKPNKAQAANEPQNLFQKQKYTLQEANQDMKKQISQGPQYHPHLSKQSSSSHSGSQGNNRLKEFERVREIGRGAYGTVYKVRNKKNQYLAMKEVSSIKLKKDKKTHQVYMEKVMRHFKFSGIPEFYSCFTQDNQFYFLMAFAEGGQLSRLIKRYHQHLTQEVIQFYIAEMVLILEYIHSLGFSHRDFKPENLVLTKEGHLQLIDFGTLNDYCKKLIPPEALNEVKLKDDYRRNKITSEKMREVLKRQQEGMHNSEMGIEDSKANNSNQDAQLLPCDKEEIESRLRSQTFCGTAEYLSPEMLEDDICDMNGDLWALGCIIYKMFTNNTPFVDSQEFLIFNKIKQGNFNRNHEQIPQVARDLISKLLVIEQHERLGAVVVDDSITKESVLQAYSKLKAHPFFEGIVWESLYKQQPPQLVQDILSGQFDLMKKQQQLNDKPNQVIANSNQQNNQTLSDDDDDDDDDEDDEINQCIQRQSSNQNQNNDNPDKNDKTPKMKVSTQNQNQEGGDRRSIQKLDLIDTSPRKHNSEDLSKSPVSSKERNSTSTSSSNLSSYLDVLQILKPPFTEANLYYQVQINKVNKKLLIFSIKRPRQILLFNNDPITIIYYIPQRSKVNLKYIILDDRTTVTLESPNRIVINDQQDKYIFENPKQDTPQQLYQAIQSLKQQKQQQN